MAKCSYCKAELEENEPICSYCNMYNKQQMLENEKTKETIQNSEIQKQQEQKDKDQSSAAIIKCLLPASIVLTVGLFFFISALLPVSLVDAGIAFMFGFFGIPIGFICAIVGTINSMKEIRMNSQNKIAKNSIAMIIFGVTAAIFSDTLIGILILGIELTIYSLKMKN